MQFTPSKLTAILFTVWLLAFTNLVRSEIIIDTSFLPRALSLTSVLFVVFYFLFRKKAILKPGIWTLSLLAFYLWSLMSCLWSTSMPEALMQSQLIFLGISVLAIISIFDREYKDFESIFIRTHILVLLFSFTLAFYKMSSLPFFDPYKINSISINNNLYSGFLLLSLPILFLGYSLFKRTWKYLTVFTIILTLFFIIIVQSRAVYMGLVLSFVIISTILLLRYRQFFTRKNILTGLISALFLATALFAFYHSLDETRRNAFESKIAIWNYFITKQTDTKAIADQKKMDEESSQSYNSSSPVIDIPVEYFENVNSRLIFWKKSLGLIRRHPVAGIGAGNWRIMVASVSEPRNPEHTVRNYTYSQPHNEWICILSELGIIGFLLAIMVFFVPVILILLRLLSGRRNIPVSVVFLSGFLAGFFVYASFDFPFKRIEHIVLFYSLMAFMFNKEPFIHNDKRKYKAFPDRKIISYFFTVLLIFTGIIIMARLKGERNTLLIFKNERRNDNAVIHYCKLAQNTFYTITPNTLPVDWFEGVAHYRLQDYYSAQKCFESALKSTPYEVRLRNDYGITLYSLGKTEQAIQVLKNTLKIDPDFDEPKFNLCAIYYSLPKPDSALFYVSQCRDSQKKKDYLHELAAAQSPR